MFNLNWSRKELTKQRLGSFGEYYAKMVLASYGMSIYTSEVDDHGIDFVAETKNGFMKFQVKTVRHDTNYVYMLEEHFDVEDESLFLFLSILTDGELPVSYIVPATVWKNDETGMFEDRATEQVFNRNLPLPKYEVMEDARMLTIKTDYFKIYYVKGAPFKGNRVSPASNLKVELLENLDPNKQNRFWYYK